MGGAPRGGWRCLLGGRAAPAAAVPARRGCAQLQLLQTPAPSELPPCRTFLVCSWHPPSILCDSARAAAHRAEHRRPRRHARRGAGARAADAATRRACGALAAGGRVVHGGSAARLLVGLRCYTNELRPEWRHAGSTLLERACWRRPFHNSTTRLPSTLTQADGIWRCYQNFAQWAGALYRRVANADPARHRDTPQVGPRVQPARRRATNPHRTSRSCWRALQPLWAEPSLLPPPPYCCQPPCAAGGRHRGGRGRGGGGGARAGAASGGAACARAEQRRRRRQWRVTGAVATAATAAAAAAAAVAVQLSSDVMHRMPVTPVGRLAQGSAVVDKTGAACISFLPALTSARRCLRLQGNEPGGTEVPVP